MSIVMTYGPHYPPGEWLPATIDMRNPTNAPVSGHLSIPVGTSILQVPTTVPPRSKINLHIPIYLPVARQGGQVRAGMIPPIAIVRWVGERGGELDRTELLARSNAVETSGGKMILCNSGRSEVSGDAYEASVLVNQFKVADLHTAGFWLGDEEEEELPRTRAGYEACRAVILDVIDVAKLDAAQRQALLDYVISGGIVVFPAPLDTTDPASSWLAPYFPVRPVGNRVATHLSGQFEGRAMSINLLAPMPVYEAIPGDGEVIWQDELYVHAAVKHIGKGRLVFTSFPIAALDPKNPESMKLWAELLDLNSSIELLPAEQEQPIAGFLQSMAGLETAPWTLAAAIAGGFVLVMVALQLMFFGARRPAGFVVGIAVAVVLALALVVLAKVHLRQQNLSGYRLAFFDVSSNGGGSQEELLAFLGKDDPNFVFGATRPDISIKPVTVGSSLPMLEVPSFIAPDAGVYEAKIERVWRITGAVPFERKLAAVGRFSEAGLNLSIDNQLGQQLEAPILLWNSERFSLADIPVGQGSELVQKRNLPGEFGNVGIVRSESGELRGNILREIVRPSAAVSYVRPEWDLRLFGWSDDAFAPALVSLPGDETVPMRTQAIVQTTVRLEPSPVGSRIKIEPAFTKMLMMGGMGGLPYDVTKNEWFESPTLGQFVIGFAAPPDAGQIRAVRATFQADISAPQNTITFRRGQCRGGTVRMNPAGDVIATWKNSIGFQEPMTFECTSDDIDENGWVWIMLSIETDAVGGLPPRWHFRELLMGYEAEVVGPPRAPILPVRPGHSRNDENEE